MKKSEIRVRFAPSPSGFMHLGNVRSALINFLFARQKNGTFILRIEDTDQQRNVDPAAKQIIADLNWLGITYDEGPEKEGGFGPYYQSERTSLYNAYLKTCEDKKFIYRCFCTAEELEKKRQRQLALRQPPRYDRACAHLPESTISEKLAQKVPFIWRFKLDYEKSVSFYDLAHKTMHFELKHFSDVPVTRQDGSYTFLFANFIDDLEMKITHVFRGEDHLTNTAAQVAMYEAFESEVPVFWHLPIIGNAEGKKLSKRDFGFSLNDLREAGYLPEALTNYLAIVGHSVAEEIMDLQKSIDSFNFEHLSSTGQIRYDLEKLRWINHHWIMHYDTAKLTALCRPFIEEQYPAFKEISDQSLASLIKPLQQELITLKESAQALSFIVERPQIDSSLVAPYNKERYQHLFKNALQQLDTQSPDEVVAALQKQCKAEGLSIKDVFSLLRIALTGKAQGPSVKDLMTMLSLKEVQERLAVLV